MSPGAKVKEEKEQRGLLLWVYAACCMLPLSIKYMAVCSQNGTHKLPGGRDRRGHSRRILKSAKRHMAQAQGTAHRHRVKDDR